MIDDCVDVVAYGLSFYEFDVLFGEIKLKFEQPAECDELVA